MNGKASSHGELASKKEALAAEGISRKQAAQCERLAALHDRGDPLGYVLSANVARRHMGESQRAMVAARLAVLPLGANQHRKGSSIELPTQADAASRLNVGVATLKKARVVLEGGDRELIALVDEGVMAVEMAAKVARMPEDQ